MEYTNTLGLTITHSTTVRKRRLLPLPGEVLVKEGDTVTPDSLVAYVEIPGKPVMISAAARLEIEPENLMKYMLKQAGDEVHLGERIAFHKSFLGLSDTEVLSPTNGTLESILTHTGMIALRTPTIPVRLHSYMAGKVVEVIEHEGVMIESPACYIEGVFGVGGERHGVIHLAVSEPTDVLDAAHITADMTDQVVVGGSLITRDALVKASQLGVAGLIVGGVDDEDLAAFLGYDIGLAITGHEPINLTLILTEGFGQIPMTDRTFGLFKQLDGSPASINGATHIRAGIQRPEVIIPQSELDPAVHLAPGILSPGAVVRVVREPYMGRQGEVLNLPMEPLAVSSGVVTPVAIVKMEDGTAIAIPQANLEIIG